MDKTIQYYGRTMEERNFDSEMRELAGSHLTPVAHRAIARQNIVILSMLRRIEDRLDKIDLKK